MPPDERALATGRSTRSVPRALLIVAVVLLAARVASAVWEHAHPPVAQDLVRWRPLAVAETEALAAKRPILYDFSAAWCGPCQTMEAEVFRNEAGAKRINDQMIATRVVDRSREDGHNPPEIDALQRRFEVSAFPTLVLYDPRTKKHQSIVGYPGRDELLKDLSKKVTRLKMGEVLGGDSL